MKKKSCSFIYGIILCAVFIAYTALVKFVDVKAVGPEGSAVGFATLNRVVADMLPFNNVWYQVSEVLGLVAIGVCLGFALLGAWQLIKGKGFKAVDKGIWVLAGFYVVVMAFYAAFEVIVINYRPVILDEGLEASYPSSHTMLAVCVFISAFYEFDKYISKNAKILLAAKLVVVLAAVLTVVARTLSGVHWISDIIGGVLLSVSLLAFFLATDNRIK